jgi:hypothetical protein
VNPADRYIVAEKSEDTRLFTRREGSIPYGPDRSEKTGSSHPTANGTAGKHHDEPVPGTSTGGETQPRSSPASTEAERRIINMFAATGPGNTDENQVGDPIHMSESVRTDKEIIGMFQIGKPDQEAGKVQGDEVFEPRSRPDDREGNIFDERMDMFTAGAEKNKQPKCSVGNGSVAKEVHETEELEPTIPGEIPLNDADGTINVEGTGEQETAT